MLYVDEPRTFRAGFEDWCHLWSNTMDLNELNAFARRLGLRPAWLQCSVAPTGKFWHYDLSPAKRALALLLKNQDNTHACQFKPMMEWLKEQHAKVAK